MWINTKFSKHFPQEKKKENRRIKRNNSLINSFHCNNKKRFKVKTHNIIGIKFELVGDCK